MKRRGVLSLLGGAAVAGPSMAKAAVAQGMEAMSLGNSLGFVGAGVPGYATGTEAPYSEGPAELAPTDPRHWVQRQLSDFLGQTAEELREQRLRTQVHALDADLAVNRSFSLAAKVRIQRDRNFERGRDEHKSFLLRDVANAVKRWNERGSADF